MRRDTAPRWALPLLILLSFAGAGIGLVLVSYHMSQGKPSKLFQLACGTDGSGCREVLSSPWSVVPPGVPLADVGFVYFAGLGLWYLIVGLANRRGRFWQGLPLAAQILGALASLFYLGVMLTQLRAICWWCTLSHLINFALLFVAWKAWPRDDGYSNEPARPGARLAIAGVLLVLALAAITFLRGVNAQSNRYVEAFRNDMDLQRYLVQRQAQRTVAVQPDDPVRGNPSAVHTVVVFSDFQCPSCRAFAELSERELLPRFGNRMRLVFKHFPLEGECNQGVPPIHPQACEAALAAEAARELGGNEAFWKMHDVLYARQAELPQGPWADLGRQAGLDGAAVADRVARRAGLDRILRDTAAGRATQLRYTPAVLVDGRPMEDWTRLDVWQALLGGS